MRPSSMTRRGLTAIAAAALALPLVATAPAQATAPALVTPACTDVSVSRSTFVRPGIAFVTWRENLAFDGRGRMWVSNNVGNRLEAYDPSGAQVATVAATGPGGIALAPSGRMEVNTGIGPFSSGGTISSFDPDAAAPALRTEVSGLKGHNGLAVDARGNRYVTSESAATVSRYRADGTLDAGWTEGAKASGTNGAWVDGSDLYVSRMVDHASSVVAMGTDEPAPRTVASLSPYVIGWKALDDMTVVGDHVYVAAFATGEVIRVDTRTGASCRLVGGIALPTSVRAPVAFGSADPERDLYVTAADGAITRLTVTSR